MSRGASGGAELAAAGLVGGQGGPGLLADPPGLVLGDGGQDVDGQAVGGGDVAGDEVHLRLHQAGEEVDVAGQAVELGDDQGGAEASGVGDGVGQLGAVGPLAALHLLVGAEDRGAAGLGELLDGGDLALQA